MGFVKAWKKKQLQLQSFFRATLHKTKPNKTNKKEKHKKVTYCNHARDFPLKICGVVNDIVVWMSHPRLIQE